MVTVNTDILILDGYRLFHKDRSNKTGGWVVLYIVTNINPVDISLNDKNNNKEHISVNYIAPG